MQRAKRSIVADRASRSNNLRLAGARNLSSKNLTFRHNTFDWTPPKRIDSFTCFPRLPLEIRTLIFEAYEDEPRVFCFTRANPTGITRFSIDVHCKAPLPVLLQTTQESRVAVIKKYRFVMNRTLLYTHLTTDIFYFDNFETYDIYLRHYLTLAGREKSEVKGMVTAKEVATQLKHIVIDHAFANEKAPEFDAYTYWAGLESVTIDAVALAGMMGGQTSYSDFKNMNEKWESVWKGIAQIAPLMIIAVGESIKNLVENGDYKWILKKVEEKRSCYAQVNAQVDDHEKMMDATLDSDSEESMRGIVVLPEDIDSEDSDDSGVWE